MIALASMWMGCAPVVSTPPAAQPSRARTRPLACTALPSGELRCGPAAAEGWKVALPFLARVAVPRSAGGAYVLGADGLLARVDGRGRLSGVFQTDLTSVVTTRDYVCGLEESGRVWCARDHHHDRTCPGVALEELEASPFGETALSALRSAEQGERLCGEDALGRRACVSGRAACDTLCLSYPSCSPLRCLDACSEREIGAQR